MDEQPATNGFNGTERGLGATLDAPKPLSPAQIALGRLRGTIAPPAKPTTKTQNKPLSFPCPRCHSTNTVANPNFIEGELCCRRCSKHFTIAADAVPVESSGNKTGWKWAPHKKQTKVKAEPQPIHKGVDVAALTKELDAKLGR